MARERKKYIPSYKRADNPPPMRRSKYTLPVLLALGEHRLLSRPQIEALCFSSKTHRGNKTYCQRRLQLLYHHGLVGRIALPLPMGAGRAPFVYFLDERGMDLVASMSGCDRADLGCKPPGTTPGTQFVSHTLAVNDFRVAMTLLARTPRFDLEKWVGEAQFRTAAMKDRVPIRMRGARTVRNYPDGYFALIVPGAERAAHFFLEIDQGTMSNKRWQDKMKAYVEFRSRGLSKTHFGTARFRLLTVTTTERRLKNLKKATEKAGADHHFWFTTQDNVDIWQPQKLLASVWFVATQDEKSSLLPQPAAL